MWELVVRPAARKGGKAGGGLPRRKPGKSRMPTKEEYILIGTQTFGQDAATLAAEYDKAMGDNGNHG